MRTAPLAVVLALVLAGCSGAKPKPTGAGSTAVLRLLRDWRGVWSGQVRDSPMGGMPYTLFVEEASEGLRLTSAPMREADLDGVKHVYRLLHFDRGTPVIEFALTQKARTQKGELSYREDLSSEDEAVFCPEEAGCDKVQLSARRAGERALELEVMVDEARHAAITLAFTSRKIPADRSFEPDLPATERPERDAARKPKVQLDEEGHPLDQDVVLEEHLDEDVGTEEPAPAARGEDEGDDDF